VRRQTEIAASADTKTIKKTRIETEISIFADTETKEYSRQE
jgi:hypothetical protein